LASRGLGRIVDGGKAVVVTGLRPLIFHLGLLREFAWLLDEKVPVCVSLPLLPPSYLGPNSEDRSYILPYAVGI
jgi:hypothetical protein